jgi:hypothetical protein
MLSHGEAHFVVLPDHEATLAVASLLEKPGVRTGHKAQSQGI